MGRGKGTFRPSSKPRRHLMDALPPRPTTPTKRPRFAYLPHRHLDTAALLRHAAATEVEIVVPAEHFTQANPCCRARQLWGSEVYTDDSDVVAASAHAGLAPLPPARPLCDHVLLRVAIASRAVRRTPYRAQTRHGLRSREWAGAYDGADVRPISAALVSQKGAMVRRPSFAEVPARLRGLLAPHGARLRVDGGVAMHAQNKKGRREVAPLSDGYVAMFDLCNDPCLRYELYLMLAEGVEARFENEVLYVEGEGKRYEITKEGDSYRFGRVKKETLKKGMLQGAGLEELDMGIRVPLKEEEIEVLNSDLAWDDLFWDEGGLTVKDVRYPVERLAYRERDAEEE